MNKNCGNYQSSWCADFGDDCNQCPVNTLEGGRMNIRENMARKMAFQALHDSHLDTEDSVWEWVVNEGFLPEWFEKADELLTLLKEHIEVLGVISIDEAHAVWNKEWHKDKKFNYYDASLKVAQAQLQHILEEI